MGSTSLNCRLALTPFARKAWKLTKQELQEELEEEKEETSEITES